MVHGLDRSVHEALRPEDVIAHEALGFVHGWKVFPAEANIQRQVRTDFPVILNEQGIRCSAEVSLAIQVVARGRVEAHTLEEAARVIGKIQQAAELVIGTLEAGLIVVILLSRDVHAELEGVITVNPVYGIAKCKGVFRQLARCRPRLPNTHERAYVSQTTGVEVEKGNLRNAIVRLTHRLHLVKCEAREIKAHLVDNDG